MKKLLSVISVLFVMAFLGSMMAAARVPEDGEFISTDQYVVVGNAAANGVPLEFIGCEGAWARRAIYQGEYVKLDGFKMVLGNVSLAKGSQIAICFSDGVNPWVDASTLLFGVTTSTSDRRVSDLEAPNGYMYVRQLPDIGNEKPYPVAPVALEAPLGDEVTIEFKKSGSDWQYIVNGQAFTVSEAVMSEYMKFSYEEVLFSIGDCPGIGSKNTYTVKYLPSFDGEDDTTPSTNPVTPPSATETSDNNTSEPSKTTASAPASSGTKASTSGKTQGSAVNGTTAPSSEAESGNNGAVIAVIVVTVVVLLACAGVVVFLLKKKKPADKSGK